MPTGRTGGYMQYVEPIRPSDSEDPKEIARRRSNENLKAAQVKGQISNPNGNTHTRKNRISNQLNKLLTDGDIEIICRTLFAMGTGNVAMMFDPVTGERRNPDIRWFAMLLEQIAGKEEYAQVNNAMQVIVERRDRIHARRLRRVEKAGSQAEERLFGTRNGDAAPATPTTEEDPT
ncbi:MAG TPA: hypothetical protein VJ508_16735 [Saprospiraceae bacterium]|nr:hypothetical protein [Saprospiraceae bacterium]